MSVHPAHSYSRGARRHDFDDRDRRLDEWLAVERRRALERGPALRAASLRQPAPPRGRPDDSTYFAPYGHAYKV
jgi:hypothetical protein